MNISQTHEHGEQTCGWQGGEKSEEGIDWELGISRFKLLYIGWVNKVLLYSTGNYIQYPVINHNGNEYEEEWMCAYVQLNRGALQQKWTQHDKF